MTFCRILPVILLAGVTILVCATSIPVAGEAYGNLRGDWTGQVQDWLTHAAMKSPKWQSQRGAIERHIENVGFLLQSASLAIRIGDYAVANMNVRYAIKALELGIERGFYRRIDVEPLKLLITQHVPTLSRRGINGLSVRASWIKMPLYSLEAPRTP